MPTSNTIKTVAIFCGSKSGTDPVFEKDAIHLGELIGKSGLKIIYGGGNRGLMGAVANAALKAGGFITGVIPEKLVQWERQHAGLSELVVTETMHQRKKLMYDRCDAAVVLPGGFGTLDELFEMLTWNQLQIHDKQIFLLNSGNFYQHLMEHIRNMEATDFLYEKATDYICLCNSPEEILERFTFNV